MGGRSRHYKFKQGLGPEPMAFGVDIVHFSILGKDRSLIVGKGAE